MMINNLFKLTKISLPLQECEDGQDLAEYALVLFFVAIVAVAGLTALGSSVADVFTRITAGLAG